MGDNALLYNETGSFNTALGRNAGYNATGTGNVFIGYTAGNAQTSGDYKLYVSSAEITYDSNGDISNIESKDLITGDFSSGDLSLGQTSGTVTILNDADIDGTLTLGSISDVESEINSNATNISSNDTDIASNTMSISANTSDIATNASDIASELSKLIRNGKTRQIY